MQTNCRNMQTYAIIIENMQKYVKKKFALASN